MATKKNQVLVPDHIYVPKHEIMTKQEGEEILKNTIVSQLNYLNFCH
jgi:DNA-directed RNA polymerase, subunit H, RpoH/RPB5